MSQFLKKEASYLEMELLQVWLVYLLDNSHNLSVNRKTIIMQIALDILKLDKSEVAMVGDLYDTDIMSGINVGWIRYMYKQV